MKVMAVVQARMGSSRLPNKVMAMIRGIPMIGQVINRARRARTVGSVVLSIPNSNENDALCYFARQEGIDLYRGDEEDLLARTIGTLNGYPADAVVRITGDCPMVDPAVIDKVVTTFVEGHYDYVSNVFPKRTYPAGIAVEVYSATTMRYLDRMIAEPSYREYYMAWLWQRGRDLRTRNVEFAQDLSAKRWTVDELADLTFVRAVYDELGNDGWGMEEVLALLRKRPQLETINSYVPIEPFKGLKEQK